MGFSIAGRAIGRDAPPFVIAEMSGNHNQSLERALAIVDAAAAAGAHALKIQTYTADSMTLPITDGEFAIRDPKSLWNGRTLYELYQEAATPYDWHRPIFDRCREKGVIGFSTPFDADAVDFLESLGAPAYKIASFENVDLPLIAKAASTGKPLIISTGMATSDEIADAVNAARSAGGRDIVLLKCTSTYPATPRDTNIRTIPDLRERFGCEVGLSDHTMGTGVAVASIALGAVVVEKHFTLSRAEGGVDSAFSLEPPELAALVTETRRAWESLGDVSYGPTASEQKSLQFRRSLYFVADIRAGTKVDAAHVRAIRPGSGLAPKHLGEVIGRTVARDVKRGTPVSWDALA
ncbi:MAG TPA: pseudaminic acid synthase [Ramlibacter sp.]